MFAQCPQELSGADDCAEGVEEGVCE